MGTIRRDPHRRWRDLAATALDFDLDPVEKVALEAHLGSCGPCRRHAAALGADAALLRALPMRDSPAAIWRKVRASTRP